MQRFLKNIVWGCLLVIPFIALYVASGCGEPSRVLSDACPNFLDIVNWGTSGFYFPFISGKNLLFRFLVEIAFFSWVALALANPTYRLNWKKSPLLIAYGVFMLVLLVADIFGADPWRSFWSNFERMEGFFGHIHLFAYFVVLSAMLHSLKDYTRVLKAFVYSNVVVLVFGFGQLIGAQGYVFHRIMPGISAKFGNLFPIHMSDFRLDATLGNSAYFAVYCLMFIFILALMWEKEQFARAKWGYPLLMVLNLVALFYTGTRGTQIGLLVGGFITLGLIGLYEKGRVRNSVAGALVVMVLLVASVFTFKNTSFIQSSPTLARFASISPYDLTGMSRLSIWKISYEAWKEHPLLGYGQENFANIYAEKFIPEKMWNLEPWYDRSHDVFFDWLIAGGIIGLLSYLSLYVVALWLMWRKKSEMPVRERAILTGLLAGYFVHNIFVFDNLISYIMFFFLLAYVAWRTGTRGEAQGGKAVASDLMNSLYAPALGIVFLVSAYFMLWKPVQVNHNLVQGLDINRLVQTMAVPDAIAIQQASFEKAIAAHVVGSEEAREQFLQTTVRMAQITIPSDVPTEDRTRTVQAINGLVQAARADVAASYESHQDDIRMLSIYGMFFLGLGDGGSAEKVLAHAHELAPNKQLISMDLVRAYLLENKTSDAYSLAKETFESAPLYTDAAKLALIAGIYDNKWQEIRQEVSAKGGSVSFDPDVLSVLLSTKQTTAAIAYLNELKAENPSYAAQVDAYISQILAGKAK